VSADRRQSGALIAKFGEILSRQETCCKWEGSSTPQEIFLQVRPTRTLGAVPATPAPTAGAPW